MLLGRPWSLLVGDSVQVRPETVSVDSSHPSVPGPAGGEDRMLLELPSRDLRVLIVHVQQMITTLLPSFHDFDRPVPSRRMRIYVPIRSPFTVRKSIL